MTHAMHVSKQVTIPASYGGGQTKVELVFTVDADGDVRINESVLDENIFFNKDYLPLVIQGLQELLA